MVKESEPCSLCPVWLDESKTRFSAEHIILCVTGSDFIIHPFLFRLGELYIIVNVNIIKKIFLRTDNVSLIGKI